MKRHMLTIILISVFLVGLMLMLYPSFSNYWNQRHQSQAIASYINKVDNMDDEDCKNIMEEAYRYNEKLAETGNIWRPDEAGIEEYKRQLDISGTGIMGYVYIPKLDCSLPIYHGTDDTVLQVAAGHVVGSSLPVGGESTHSILSSHRGLPSAKLFTDLDKLEEGDLFMIQVLNETLTYKVDRINIVMPDEIESLKIEQGKDLCTLVTCTPYGINTHRLLVHGYRVENQELDDLLHLSADATQVRPLKIAPLIAVPILILVFVIILIAGNKKTQKDEN